MRSNDVKLIRLWPVYSLLVVVLLLMPMKRAEAIDTETIRVGIIGLDTSHAIAFTKELNQEPAAPEMLGCRVTAAYPYGSREIESSASRIPEYIEAIKQHQVAVVDSIDELLDQVDCVLLETNDGRLHLEQAIKVCRAGKPVFVDKPTGSNLSEVIAVLRAAEHFGGSMFSSSSLRYSEGPQAIRDGKVGKVLGCDAYSPSTMEATHVDLFWYGIHGVETLYTCMGVGCESVQHFSQPDHDFVVGKWSEGRIGTFRGMRDGKRGFGATAFGEKGIEAFARYDGYRPLLIEIAKFFRSGQAPVDPAETIEIYAFMQAASVSKSQHGREVRIADVIRDAEHEAQTLLAEALEGKRESKK